MKKQVTVYVIYTTILGRKKYIADTSRKTNNAIVVAGYTEVVQEAHTWNSEDLAETAIGKIHNPQDRHFECAPVLMPTGKKPSLKLQEDIQ